MTRTDAIQSFQLDDLKRAEKYFLMSSTIVPRPIAMVSTLNNDGTDNLAAFSYFNAVSTDPPCVMFSITHHRDGKKKDTQINIEREKEFVIHIAQSTQMTLVEQTGESLPYGQSEREKLGLTQEPSTWIRTPRVAEFKVAFECVLEKTIEIGTNTVVFGRILGAHYDPTVLQTDAITGSLIPRADSAALDPLARMDRDYGKVIDIAAPTS
jgi:flavin reductase (DIM6/NTAB) family NADH-FMN oxidoreductase RutF